MVITPTNLSHLIRHGESPILLGQSGRNRDITVGTWLTTIGEKAVAEDEANTLNNKKVL